MEVEGELTVSAVQPRVETLLKKKKTTKTEWDDLQILVRLKEMLFLF